MAIFVLSDLHLSTDSMTDKSMEVFGARWQGYIPKIEKNWNAVVGESDTVVVPGDVSWATKLCEAESDLRFLDSLNGKKLIGKGNHDFWWTTASKLGALFEANGIGSISLLNNNAIEVENFILAGSRGWFTDKSMQNTNESVDYEKIVNRETIRLGLSLEAASKLSDSTGKEMVVFLHFPPVWSDFVCQPIIELLGKYGVKRCYFGHIHGNYSQPDSFVYENIKFSLISADFLDFIPRIV